MLEIELIFMLVPILRLGIGENFERTIQQRWQDIRNLLNKHEIVPVECTDHRTRLDPKMAQVSRH